jgi:tRNA dimethylallyltransferase
LAQQLDTEIISADSRQFYREMSIGTAKPSANELAAVPHHFINSLSVTDDYSVGDFERDGLRLLDRLFQTKHDVVLAGGSGLFINALCKGLDEFPNVTAEHRAKVAAGETERGLAWLQEQVATLDPLYFERVDQANPARLRRALEVCFAGGQPYSAFLNTGKAKRRFECVYICLDWPREALYQRIDSRVDAMIEAGLEAEAHTLLPYRDRPALRTVGYEEWFAHFDGQYTRAEAIDKIKQHSRNYAKRQITWFKKHADWQHVHPDDWDGMLSLLKR